MLTKLLYLKEQYKGKRRSSRKKKRFLKKRPKHQKARNTNTMWKSSRPSSNQKLLPLYHTINKKQRLQMQKTMDYQKSKLKKRLQGKRKVKRQR